MSSFFECRASEELLSVLLSEWKLSQLSENDKIVQKFLRHMPAEDSNETGNSSFYANSNAIEGDKGVLLTMRHTKSKGEILVAHYYYNF